MIGRIRKIAGHENGFTLVETVVTVVVVAVLAAVAIPMYSGYVTQARQNTVNNLAETASAAANAFYKKTNTDPTPAQLNLFYNPGEIGISVNPPNITAFNVKYPTIDTTIAYR